MERGGVDAQYCTQCGRRLHGRGLTCPTCGAVRGRAEQTRPTPVVRPDDDVPPRSEPAGVAEGTMLVVRSGPIAGSQFWLAEGRHSIGRAPDSRILLDDVTVSRHHAEVEVASERVTLRDLGSLNGTYVNGARVDDAVLGDGDDVMIGRFRLVFLTAR